MLEAALAAIISGKRLRADLSDPMCLRDIGFREPGAEAPPCGSELRLAVVEAETASVASARPAVDVANPRPLRGIIKRTTGSPDPADGHAAPDHDEVVIATFASDYGDAQSEGFGVGQTIGLKRYDPIGNRVTQCAARGRFRRCSATGTILINKYSDFPRV